MMDEIRVCGLYAICLCIRIILFVHMRILLIFLHVTILMYYIMCPYILVIMLLMIEWI